MPALTTVMSRAVVPARPFLCTVLALLALAPYGCGQTFGLTSLVDSSGSHVIYVGTNHHLQQLLWNGSTWTALDITAAVSGSNFPTGNSALTSFLQSDGPHIVYVDSNQHVNQAWYTNSAKIWNAQDLTALVGTGPAAPNSALTSYVSADGSHVLYVASNSHLCQLWWNGSAWTSQDISAAVSGSNYPTGNSALTSFLQSDGPHIVYVDPNQHVNQAWYTTAAKVWNAQDLTALVGSTSAAPNSALTSYVSADGSHAVYIASNYHLSQLFWNGSKWTGQDITSLVSGANLPTGASAVTSFLQSDGPHIVYVDSNQHINQMWYTTSGSYWNAEDLTAALQPGTLAAPGGALTSFIQSDGSHLIYIDSSQNVDQMWWNGSAWSFQDFTSTSADSPLAPSAPAKEYVRLKGQVIAIENQ